MKTEIATVERAGIVIPDELARMTSDQLRRELAQSLALTAGHLVRLATIVRALEDRGEDLSDLRIGLLGYLRQIAYGQVVPELVVRYAESPALMRTLAALPLPDQQRLASGEPVALIVRRDNGRFDTRMADPMKLTRSQISQVFGRGKIRDKSEQIFLIEDQAPASPASVARRIRRGRVKADHERGGVVLGGQFFAAGDIVSALAELMGKPDNSVPEIPVSIKLTEAEHVALKNAATRSGAPMNVLIRRALMISGLFSGE